VDHLQPVFRGIPKKRNPADKLKQQAIHQLEQAKERGNPTKKFMPWSPFTINKRHKLQHGSYKNFCSSSFDSRRIDSFF
jgi:hypothetical protein